MLISQLHLVTKLDIWAPKYSSKHEGGEWTVLIAKYKVHRATPIIILNFPKAKHLEGQRFAIHRNVVEACPVVSNGRIDCYEVPFDYLEGWDTPKEVIEKVESIWN